MKLNELNSFLSGIVDILKTPSDFLSLEGNSFLRRYVAGGFFLAPAYEKHNGEENFGLVLGWEIGK